MPGGQPNPDDAGQPMKAATLRRSIVSLGGVFLFLAVSMFLPAGDLGWARGWLFLMVFCTLTALGAIHLWRTNSDIFVARSKVHQGTKGWDKVLLFLVLVSLTTIFPLAGLDSRYHWSSVPLWLTIVGYVLLFLGMFGNVWAMSVNKFAEPTVRIQTERGHKVVDTGPYAIVRHPYYLASFFLFGGISLALGSFWALIPATIAALVLIVRTALEDRTLQDELAGYREYACRVRYRLIPGVW